jgi:ribosomal-protein-serine acetyltransferase
VETEIGFEKTVGDNIKLALIDPMYSDDLYALVDRNRAHLRPWLGWVDRTNSVGDLNNFVASAGSRWFERGDVVAVILCDGAPAGVIGLEDTDLLNRSAEIGYWLGKEYEGLGLITRSVQVMLDYAFGDAGLNRVQIRVSPLNSRSKAVARRLGFVYEGTLRQVACLYDQFEDLEYYSILKEEWGARHKLCQES